MSIPLRYGKYKYGNIGYSDNDIMCQFLLGTVTQEPKREKVNVSSFVSIPLRYGNGYTMYKIKYTCLKVSIPLRYGNAILLIMKEVAKHIGVNSS